MFNRLQRRLDRAEALLDVLAVCESPDDFAMLLVTRVFKEENLLFVFMLDTDGTTEFRRLGGFGDPASTKLAQTISIWENIAVAESYRDDVIVRVEDSHTYRQRYNPTFLSPSGEGVICLPLRLSGKTVGAISLVFRQSLSLHDIDDNEIRLVQLAGEHLLRDWRLGARVESSTDVIRTPTLTKRQLSMMEKMREGLSLREIGILLSVSQATVKGEVQKIYRALGVHKKRDAISVGSRIGLFSDARGSER